MDTREQRITELTQAIERHKSLAMLLTGSENLLEHAIGGLVEKLHALRRDHRLTDQQLDEAEAALNMLLRPTDPIESPAPAGTSAAPESPQSTKPTL